MTEKELLETFVKFEPISKGWSNDKKYRVETADGRRMLLRVSVITEYDRKKSEYEMMERVYELGVFTSQPLGFDLCDNGKAYIHCQDGLTARTLR